MAKESARATAAFEAYQGLGPARSISKLHRVLSANDPECPSLSGLKYFSRHHKWVDRVAEYDAKVAESVQEKAIEQEADKRVDAMGAVDALIVQCGEMLDRLKTMTPISIQTPQDLRATATTLAETARLKELLEGRATDRVESMSHEEIKAELADYEADVIAKFRAGLIH